MANKMTGHKWASHAQWVMSPVQVWFCLYVYSSVSQLCLFHMSQCQVCIFVHISWFLFYFNSLASRVLSFPFVSSYQLSCLVLSSQRFHPGLRLSSIGFLCLAFCSLCFYQSSQSPLAFCFVVFCAANNKGFHLSVVCIWFHLFLFTQSTLAYHDTNR